MRLVFDFISGIITGLRSDDTSYPKNSLAKARRGAAAEMKPGFVAHLARFCGLLVGAGCAALAIFAASDIGKPAQPNRNKFTSAQAQLDAMLPDDVLVTDPDAPPRGWRYIVIHHSGTNRGSAQSFDESHRRERGWRCLGYHFVIGNGIDQGDGVVVAGPRWYGQEAGAHANSAEYNERGIGICLVGNFDNQPPTPAQWSATKKLVTRLAAQHSIPAYNIVGHNDIRRGGTTACPGKLLPLTELRDGL